MRKFCQNLQNAQLCRPKTGILSAFLPSAAGQNSDTFPVLHTVERGGSLQGREKIGDVPRKRPRPLRHGLRRATSPKGRGLGKKMKFAGTAKGSPFGRAVTIGDGEGEDANRSAALSQKAALQMPFAFTTPPVKRQFWKIRRFSRIAKL